MKDLFENKVFFVDLLGLKAAATAEMEYCTSAASMLAEEFCGISVSLWAQIMNVEEISRMINNVDSKSYIGKTMLWEKCLKDSNILQNDEST